MTNLAVPTPLRNYEVRMFYNTENGKFVAEALPLDNGRLIGMCVFDSLPSVIVTVQSSSPAHAIAAAWDKASEARQSAHKHSTPEEFLQALLAQLAGDDDGIEAG